MNLFFTPAHCLRSLVVFLFLLPAAWTVGQDITLSGQIRTPTGAAVEQVAVEINDGASFAYTTTTDVDGWYSFVVPSGGNYTITPSYDYVGDCLNGVTTFDLVLISKHVHDLQYFTSPYQLIAADADNSGTVDLLDSLELRKLILGIYTALPNNACWRFVRADYVFPDPTNPFSPPYPETVTTGVTTQSIAGIDFIGIKIGDVNGSAIANGGEYPTPPRFRGSARIDQNVDCQVESSEQSLAGWAVTAHSSGNEFYTLTRNDGTYVLNVPDGTYDVWITPPNALWDVCIDTVFGIQMDSVDVDTVDFSVTALGDCPLMQVELSSPVLIRCVENYYSVFYCNQGTVTAENARVEVTFDPYFEISSSTLPWTSVNDDTYTFDLGDVPAGYCGNFIVQFTLSCEAELGQTHCTTAHAFPDSLCGPFFSPNWDGSDLRVSGACQGDQVVFTVTNYGAPMTKAVDYVVIEDIMIQMVADNSIQLNADESTSISLPANGSTWRMEVDQPDDHPWSIIASAAVEGCGENAQGNFDLGFVTQFPNNDESASEDEDCQENVGSYDPNDKQGFPRGVDAEHYIRQDQEIEYLVRFQNTGTYQAFNIIVLDTLAEWLDPSTVRPLGSSHPYTWQLFGPGILQFLFEDINLPDSAANEPGSHGYIKFAVKPKTGLPDGTLIENQAAIYFDFNLPVITNRTWHTLGEQFLNVSNVSFQPGLTLGVWPNPTAAEATFFLQSARVWKGRLKVFDARGRLVQGQEFSQNRFGWDARGLLPGLYFFRLEGENGEALGAGKIQKI